uniref:Tic22-like family protein n=2 Tax=Rhodosorus marinus TaxID=101924 RepID=A0A7S3EA24_9RHOD|mmetsp:Transcript_1987/g.7867  ORF Transcript_1987/g.7867 Transcript_1987/m.7867 type:complete len:281 (+) Transcript_1987:579-1421(+)|eukprot:CAMPEP_0113963356 /NCGR_PEP_ID=MMETSP0011_2-20120614/6466_1 /TAXON_ID=101924 /ORGANISM="Rhodosorus marinus" /LENGTH=280 /DNA_ID=CAMNT_0000975393 /DNA_START=121 /DNA_END=963 /DNA_ORIENTATION=+ /assembly_acc=CAM_ASM_000156
MDIGFCSINFVKPDILYATSSACRDRVARGRARVGRVIMSSSGGGKQKKTGMPRWVAGVGFLVILTALVSPAFAPLLGPPRLSDAEINQRLNKVVLFSVTDQAGKPFLTETAEERIGYFFFDPTDAEAFLSKAKEFDESAKIFPVTLDEAYKFVARKGGDTFRLMANRTDVQEAEKIIGSPFSGSAPLFFIDGMSFQSADGEKKVIPLFFEKEDLEATITKLARENPALKDSIPDEFSVIDLGSALDEMKSGRNPALQNVVFYPSENALAYLRSMQGSGN